MSFAPVACTIANGDIYLNVPSSYYTINISLSSLGSNYTPDPNDPYNEPGTWSIRNIFAGPVPSSGTVPTTIFSLGQQPVTFYIQNVGAVPINVVFLTNNSPNAYTYFSFGVPPNETPSTYLLNPLSILIIQTVFTSNNVIRFYNSFLDSINYDHLARILDQANKVGYYDSSGNTIVGPDFEENLTITSDYTLSLATTGQNTTQYLIDISGATLTLDGTDIPGDSSYLILINTKNQSNLSLVNLVGTPNYLGQPVPTTLEANVSYFVVIDSTRVVAYDYASSTTHYTVSGANSATIKLFISNGEIVDVAANNNHRNNTLLELFPLPENGQPGGPNSSIPPLRILRPGYMKFGQVNNVGDRNIDIFVNNNNVGSVTNNNYVKVEQGDLITFVYIGNDSSEVEFSATSSSFSPLRVYVPLS
jgi:hypothetical protein